MMREQGGDATPLDNSWFFDYDLNVALEHNGCCMPAVYVCGGSTTRWVEYDIHFLFPPTMRGKRALISARAMVAELFTTYGASRITGTISRVNLAARMVIRQLGFAPVAQSELAGAPAITYALDKATWLGSQQPAQAS